MNRRRAQQSYSVLLSTWSTTCRRQPCRRLFSQSHALSDGSFNFSRNAWADGPMVNQPPKEPKVAIIGGGLTGLTSAYYLAAKYLPESKITIYEGSDRVGGWIRSESKEVDVNGQKQTVMFERGPRAMSPGDMIHDQQDRLVLYDLLYDTGLACVTGPPNLPRYIYYDGRIVAMPPHNHILNVWREPLFQALLPGALYWFGKWNFRGGQTFPKEDMSVAEYITQASRSPALADVMSAGIHGVWGGDINKLSAMSVFSWFFHVSSMTRAESEIVRRRFTEEKFKRSFLAENPDLNRMYPAKPTLLTCGEYGLESLPTAIYDMLKSPGSGVDIKLGTAVSKVAKGNDGEKIAVTDSHGNTELYDKVISTIPAQHLSRVVDAKLPALDAFHAVSIMTVNIWYPEPNLVPPGIGYLIPRSCPEELNPERALGVFFDSNLLVEQTAKEGGTKVYVLFGGHYYDNMPAPSETEAVEQAKALLERHLGIPRDTPCHAEAALRKECLPQHHVGHFTRISEANQQLEDTYRGRLAAVGGSFSRPGVMGALRAGHDIARSMARENFLATGLESLQDVRVKDPLYPLSGPRALLQYSEHVDGRPVE